MCVVARHDRVGIGGSAAPKAMTQRFMKGYGVDVIHAWGMTETSPLGTVNIPLKKHENYNIDQKVTLCWCGKDACLS